MQDVNDKLEEACQEAAVLALSQLSATFHLISVKKQPSDQGFLFSISRSILGNENYGKTALVHVQNVDGKCVAAVLSDEVSPLPNDLEAVKLLADWSKWCVLVETGAIAGITNFLTKSGGLTPTARNLITASTICFGISIVTAAVLLLSLPATVQRLPPRYPNDVFHMGTFEGTKGIRIYSVVQIQTCFFIFGLVSFVVAIAGI